MHAVGKITKKLQGIMNLLFELIKSYIKLNILIASSKTEDPENSKGQSVVEDYGRQRS